MIYLIDVGSSTVKIYQKKENKALLLNFIVKRKDT